MYRILFDQMRKLLVQLESWLERAEAHAQAKAFDPGVYLEARLAPDQFPLSLQVQAAADHAKLAACRLTGKPAPPQPAPARSLAELKVRVRETVTFLAALTPEDFEGAATRAVTQPRWEGKTMIGADYFVEHAVPNFFFHLTHSYSILRHNGVPLGKLDYLGALSFRAP